MGETITLLVNDIERIKIGRLVGIIDQNECNSVINTEGALKRVFTSESIPISSLTGRNKDSRFVIASRNRTIFISPMIEYTQCFNNERNFTCEDNNDYTIKTIKKFVREE
jgi:hypothetical protein